MDIHRRIQVWFICAVIVTQWLGNVPEPIDPKGVCHARA